MALTLASLNVSAIEEPSYEVVDTIGKIEIRRYAPHNVALTRVEGEFAEVGGRAFRRLGGYIFGANQQERKISMTAPVSQASDGAGAYWVTFMMPSEHELDSLPAPSDSEVRLLARPEQTMAAIRYRGGWGEEKYRKHEAELTTAIERSERWSIAGEPVWARYNAPYVPPFLRRNEVLIPVTRK